MLSTRQLRKGTHSLPTGVRRSERPCRGRGQAKACDSPLVPARFLPDSLPRSGCTSPMSFHTSERWVAAGRRWESFPRSRTPVATAGILWSLVNGGCAPRGPASIQHLRVPEDVAHRPTPPGSPDRGGGKRRPGVGSWIRDVHARTSGFHSEASHVLEETAGAQARTAGPRRAISSSALVGGLRMVLRRPGEPHSLARPHAPGPSRSGPSAGRGRSSDPPLPSHRAGARAAPSAAEGPPLGGNQPVAPGQFLV